VNPKNQKIEPPAPDGYYYWIGLDDAETDPITLGWWLQLRKRRRFWFDKTVLRVYIADYTHTEEITPAYINQAAQVLVTELKKAQLRKQLERRWEDYVQ